MLQTPQEWAHGLVGQSQQIASIRRLIEKASVNRLPVLLLGESGTGKEVVARAIHEANARRQLVPIGCGSLVGTLMESELFGHVKGSFSGAAGDKRGLVELADGGTAFFDEIGDLPLEMQVKLLRLIEEREFRAVGSLQWRKVDLRIIAATHRDLKTEVGAGRFRLDLYYRLNVVALRRRGGGGPIPAGPVLPPQRRCPSTTGAAPPQGGHSPAGGSLSEDRERIRAERDRPQPGTIRDPPLLRLAGQRSRVEALYLPDERPPFRGRAANVGPSLGTTASLRHERSGEAVRRGGVLRSAIGQPARFCHGAEIPGNFSPRKRAASHRPSAGSDPWRARQGGAPAPYRPHHTLPEDETIRYRVTVCQIRTRLPWTRLTASARCSPGWDFTRMKS